MPMLCIAGAFTIMSTEPDGDSIHFVPTQAGDWAKVPGNHRVRVNAHGGSQLRLDAIDALETHYAPQGGHTLHQPLELAHQAASELLKWLGFRDVTRDGERVTGVRNDAVAGFILTRTADEYGRCVALVGRGDPPASSGEAHTVDVALLRRTANHRLIKTGLAYPTFYSKLYVDLREELAKQATAARKARSGVYGSDATQRGVEVVGLSTLTDDAVLLPKLFRRLVDYLHLGGADPSLAGFRDYLSQRDDRLYVISDAQRTSFDTVVKVEGQTVSLTRLPEDLVFDER